MFRRRYRAGIVAALAAATLTLTACSGSGDIGSAGGSAAADSSAESGTLKLWHYESADGAMGIAWDKAIEIFRTEHPNVQVDSSARRSNRSSRTPARS
jgi:raffinose/stachyose/melibiose transport system substrate-binding protein